MLSVVEIRQLRCNCTISGAPIISFTVLEDTAAGRVCSASHHVRQQHAARGETVLDLDLAHGSAVIMRHGPKRSGLPPSGVLQARGEQGVRHERRNDARRKQPVRTSAGCPSVLPRYRRGVYTCTHMSGEENAFCLKCRVSHKAPRVTLHRQTGY